MTDAHKQNPAKQRIRRALAVLFTVLLLPMPGIAYEGGAGTTASRSVGAAIFDAVVLRPFGFAALIVSSAAFVPIALITWPNGTDSVIEARELLIDRPAKSVFERKLGDF